MTLDWWFIAVWRTPRCGRRSKQRAHVAHCGGLIVTTFGQVVLEARGGEVPLVK
jgi:hypothetical protein